MQRPSAWNPERLLLLVVALLAVIYWRDLSYDFILDDIPLVLVNPALNSWHNLPAIFRTDIAHFPYSPSAGGSLQYRPVYVTWLLLNASLFGRVLPWWHLTSLLLHIGVTLLAFRLGVKLLRDQWLAAAAAALFALHPIHTESVAYVTASTDLLVSFFCLIALLLYMRFREDGSRVRELFISVGCFAAAVLSKESAGMFPWMLVAYEALTPNRVSRGYATAEETRGWRRYRWTLPYFAVGAAYVVVRTVLFGWNAGPGPKGSRVAALVDIPLAALVYAKNFFVPVHLSFFYPAGWSTEWTWWKATAIALVCIAAALLWRRKQENKTVRLLMTWTAILLVPPALALTTFTQDDWVHDRHVYFASIPLCLLIVYLLARLIRRPRTFAAVTAGIALLLAADTWSQVPRFGDEASVYSSALRVAPDNPSLHRFYATALWNQGRHKQALPEFRAVIRLDPNSAAPHVNYAQALAEIGRHSEALREFKTALTFPPSSAPEHAQLLYLAATQEIACADFNIAASDLRQAIAIAPRALNYHSALAEVFQHQGDTVDAEEELRLESINRKQFLQRHKTGG